MTTFSVGHIQVEKVPELDLDGFAATQLLPALDPRTPESHPDLVPLGTYDAEGHALLSLHSWLVRHAGQIILIDTGAGNHKPRPSLAVLDQLDTAFLQRLAALGVRPEAVNYVLLTHIHADHVGWNTCRDGDAWTPTFPNATVICSAREWRYGAALAAGDQAAIEAVRNEAGLGEPIRVPVPSVFEDSMLPLQAAGRLRLVEVADQEVLPGIRFVGAAGHSIDHAVIEIASDGALGIFSGDVMHHPLEVYDTSLVSMFCEFPDAARAARGKLLERLAASRALCFTSHFTLSSAGHVHRSDSGYSWRFAEAGGVLERSWVSGPGR